LAGNLSHLGLIALSKPSSPGNRPQQKGQSSLIAWFSSPSPLAILSKIIDPNAAIDPTQENLLNPVSRRYDFGSFSIFMA
jgi:hypothetical protein